MSYPVATLQAVARSRGSNPPRSPASRFPSNPVLLRPFCCIPIPRSRRLDAPCTSFSNHHDAPYSGSHVSCLSPTARNHLPHPRPLPQLNTLEDEERITSSSCLFTAFTHNVTHPPSPCPRPLPNTPATGPPSASCTCSKGKTGKLTSGNAIESGVKPNRNKRNS
ncbi:hypothetical protein BJV77DRAFT_980199 [Russula vinacea]|nr:hypothetical protein BJV77DRAFT_980199 [Russula vinacea]